MKEERSEEHLKRKKSKRSLDNYAKYSGMAFQMAAYILIGAYGGKWLDNYFETSTPYFTIILMLMGVIGAMYVVIAGVLHENKKS